MSRYAPLPVEVPYRTGPTMTKLGQVSGDSGRLFVVDERYANYVEQKLVHFSKHSERCGGLSRGEHGRQRLATSLAQMDDEVLTYEGLSAWCDPLLEYLSS